MDKMNQTRDEAKKELLAVINRRKPSEETSSKAPEWFGVFVEEISEIANRIGEINPYYKKLAEQLNEGRVFQNIEGSMTNHLMYDLENRALMIIYDTMVKKDIKVALWCSMHS